MVACQFIQPNLGAPIIDQSFRAENTSRVADQINEVLGKYGLPQFFSLPEKFLGKMFLSVGKYISGFSVPKMIEQIREEAAALLGRHERCQQVDNLAAALAAQQWIFFQHLAHQVGKILDALDDIAKPPVIEPARANAASAFGRPSGENNQMVRPVPRPVSCA